MNYQKIFSELAAELHHIDDTGNVASYIPELQNIDANKFGVHLTTVNNQDYNYADFMMKQANFHLKLDYQGKVELVVG